MFFCLGLGLLFTPPGVHAMSSKPELNTLNLSFRQNCAGRYQLELPTDMQQVKGSFGLPDIGFTVSAKNKQNKYKGIFRGKDRLTRWLATVEAKRFDDEKGRSVTKYVLKEVDTQKPLKTVVYYSDDRKLMRDENASHSYNSFFFKDFPEQQLGLTISGGGVDNVFFDRSDTKYQQHFRQKLEIMQGKAQQVHYAAWPHNRLGLCINDELIFEQNTASSQENYIVKFYNGKNSRIQFDVTSYGKNADNYIAEQIKHSSGLLSFFASTNMKVAGRKGKLIIGDGEYAGTTEFRWFSTDTKSDSIRFSHIAIKGDIDMEDYPELGGVNGNGTSLVYGILRAITIRPNGMMGVTK
ncbi:hypothetical protein PCNPT3_08325 [Psychromonas sp. CNPT3]|nr:hypothetical protein PCNPT3_08325 [Psychromonas sp. CNPT3]